MAVTGNKKGGMRVNASTFPALGFWPMEKNLTPIKVAIILSSLIHRFNKIGGQRNYVEEFP